MMPVTSAMGRGTPWATEEQQAEERARRHSPRRPGVIKSVVMTFAFHVASLLFGIGLLVLLAITGGGTVLLLVCLVAASTRSARVLIASLWRTELRMNAWCRWDDDHSQRRRSEEGYQQQQHYQGHRQSFQGARHAYDAVPPARATPPRPPPPTEESRGLQRGREVTLPVMVLSVIYFLLFKAWFNVVFSAIPLVLWYIALVQISPSSAADPDMELAPNSFMGFAAGLAFAFFAHQIGTASAAGNIYVSDMSAGMIFHREDADARDHAQTPLLVSDSFMSPAYSEFQAMQQQSEATRFSYERNHERNNVSINVSGDFNRDNAGSREGGDVDLDSSTRSAAGTTGPVAAEGSSRRGPSLDAPGGDGHRLDREFRAGVDTREIEMCCLKLVVRRDANSQPEDTEQLDPHAHHHYHAARGGRGGGRSGGRGGRGGRGEFVRMPRGASAQGRSHGSLRRGKKMRRSSSSSSSSSSSDASSDDDYRGLRKPVRKLHKANTEYIHGHKGYKDAIRDRRRNSFGSGHPHVAPGVDLKHAAHTNMYEVLDLVPSAPSLSNEAVSQGHHLDDYHYPMATPAFSAGQTLPEQQNLAKSLSDGDRRDKLQTDRSGASQTLLPRASELELYTTKQMLKEEGKKLKEEGRRLKKEMKARQKALGRKRSKENERYQQEMGGYRDSTSAPTDSSAIPQEVGWLDHKKVQENDMYARDIERAAQENVERIERQRQLLDRKSSDGLPPLPSGSTIEPMAQPAAPSSQIARFRTRPVASNDQEVRADAGISDDVGSGQTIQRNFLANGHYQAGVDLDSEIHGRYGSIPRSLDERDPMGLGAYGSYSSSLGEPVTSLSSGARYRGASDFHPGYNTFSPLNSPHSVDRESFLGTHQYDPLSPTNSLREADFPSEELHHVYRSIRFEDENSIHTEPLVGNFEDVPGKRDKVHFCSFAPPSVCPSRKSFNFTVWSFMLAQHQEMQELAESLDPTSRQLSVNTKMVIRRGALVHVTLDVPTGFKILNGATQGFPWEGKVSNAVFDIECTDGADFGQVLFKASIVVGSEVAVLRSYILVSSRQLEPAEFDAQMLESKLEVLEKTYQEIPYNSLELKELVGSGYFGDAWRAKYDGQDVVVKTIRASEFGETSDQILKEFQHEAAVLSMFGHHPCVVPFVGASTNIQYPLSLVTQYLPHGSLEDNLKKPETYNRLSVRQRSLMLKDAAAGLLNIHEGGFIHRDIAARNCLVDDELRVKICDFGLCRRVNAYGGSLMKDSVGPVKYMAPESLQPPHAFSYDSDSWMFGVLMWETYTASAPFASMTPVEAMMRVLRGERLPLPENLPGDLRLLMESCFHDSPSQRPSVAEILTALDTYTTNTAPVVSKKASSMPMATVPSSSFPAASLDTHGYSVRV